MIKTLEVEQISDEIMNNVNVNNNNNNNKLVEKSNNLVKVDTVSRDFTVNCYVCCNDISKIVILKPCNHIGLCEYCTDQIKYNNNICPMCRSDIDDTEYVFIV